MKQLLIAAVLTLTAPVALACSPLLDVSMRPLAGKDPVHLCETYDGKVLFRCAGLSVQRIHGPGAR